MPYVIVDCEAFGGGPLTGQLTEFGSAVVGQEGTKPHCTECISSSRPWFYGDLRGANSHPSNKVRDVMTDFSHWLHNFDDQPVFWSDNPAFDWQWINSYLHYYTGGNPFGWSARRISDFYAGLRGDVTETQAWKRLRQTKHDHNPVHDAIGNAEALERIMNGEAV